MSFVPKGFWRNGKGEIVPVKPAPPPPVLDKCSYCNAKALFGKTLDDGEHVDLCARCLKISIGAL